MDPRSYWQKETQKYQEPHVRLERIADEIRTRAPRGSVLDIGCGPQTLGHMLGNEYAYSGVDIVGTNEPHYKAFDLERQSLDQFPFHQPFQVVVCSGLFEYLSMHRIEELLFMIRNKLLSPNSIFIATYTNFGHITRRQGKTHAQWITKVSIPEMKQIFTRSGFTIESSYPSYYKLRGGPLKPGLWWHIQKAVIPLQGEHGILAKLFGKQYIFVLKRTDSTRP